MLMGIAHNQGVRSRPPGIFTISQIKGMGHGPTHLFSSILNMLPGEQTVHKELESLQEC